MEILLAIGVGCVPVALAWPWLAASSRLLRKQRDEARAKRDYWAKAWGELLNRQVREAACRCDADAADTLDAIDESRRQAFDYGIPRDPRGMVRLATPAESLRSAGRVGDAPPPARPHFTPPTPRE